MLALLGAQPILHVSRIRVNFYLYFPHVYNPMRAKPCVRLFIYCITDMKIQLLNISVFSENWCSEGGTILMGVSKIVFTRVSWDITIIRKKRLLKVYTLHPGLQYLWSLLLGGVLKRRGGLIDWLINLHWVWALTVPIHLGFTDGSFCVP